MARRRRKSDYAEEYVDLLTSPGNESGHLWKLEKRIKYDKKHPDVMMEMNKGKAIWDIAILRGAY